MLVWCVGGGGGGGVYWVVAGGRQEVGSKSFVAGEVGHPSLS